MYNSSALTHSKYAALLVVALLSACGGSSNTPSPQNGALPALNTISKDSGTTAAAPHRFAYVANYDTNNISTYIADNGTGVLTSTGNVAAGTGPGSVVIAPSGKFAYVPNFDSNDISIYSINAQTGALTSIGAAIPSGMWPSTLTFEPTGHFAYATNFISNDISMFSVNTATGALTSIGTLATGTNPRFGVMDASGHFLYVANWGSVDVRTYAINPQDGHLTQVGTRMTVPNSPFALTLDPASKHLYVTDFLTPTGTQSVTSFNIDSVTGMLSASGTGATAGAHPIGLTFTPSGQFAYIANSLNGVGGNSLSAYRADASTGALTAISCAAGADCATGTNPAFVAIDPSGKFAYAVNNRSNDITTYAIDSISGALSKVGSNVATGTAPLGITFTQ